MCTLTRAHGVQHQSLSGTNQRFATLSYFGETCSFKHGLVFKECVNIPFFAGKEEDNGKNQALGTASRARIRQDYGHDAGIAAMSMHA